MGKYKVMLEVARSQKDELVSEWNEEKQAIGAIKVAVSYFEAYEYGFHDDKDKGRYYVVYDGKTVYTSKWYEIPR